MSNETNEQPSNAIESSTLLGLFHRSYDYYEWDDIICVSNVAQKLKDEYEKLDVSDCYPLVDESLHGEFRDREAGHYAITEVKVV